jgi:1-acyl-sn-glycerol-3-phosphate acyltransferase
VSRLAHALLGSDLSDHLRSLRWRDAGHGYDRLGMHPEWVRASIGSVRFFYERYFRVESHGIEHVPNEGPVVIAANHSGMLPIDGAMLYTDLVRRLDPPRVPRVVADVFVPRMPFVFLLFSRAGAIAGDRPTLHRLLEDGELLVVFPEGTPGIGKPFSERYHLRPFRVGHAELALRHRAPIVPVAIIGAEEQWPQIAHIEGLHPFGAPYLPIPATLLPLPVKYHLWYGEPIALHERWDPHDADDPHVAESAAQIVQSAVQSLIDRGLRERKGIFR